jgi:hypothetical protein
VLIFYIVFIGVLLVSELLLKYEICNRYTMEEVKILLRKETIGRESFKQLISDDTAIDKLVSVACDIFEFGNHAKFAITGDFATEIANSVRAEYAEVEQRLAASKYTASLEVEKAVAGIRGELAAKVAELSLQKSAIELAVAKEREKYSNEINALKLERQKISDEFKAYSVQANGAFEVMKVQLAAAQEKEKIGEVLGKMYGGASVVSGVVKGELAEEHIYNALCEPQYMGAAVRRVGKTAHTCDIAFTWRSLAALIEVKNYSGTIPDAEFQKFERDLLGAGSDINCGIFISMANRSIGKYNTFAHSWINDRILAVYMFLDGNVANLAYAIDTAIGLIDERKRAEESVSGDEEILIAKFRDFYGAMTQKHKSLEQQIKHHTSMLATLNTEMTTVAKTIADLTIVSTGKTWLNEAGSYTVSGEVLDEKMRPKLMPLFDYTCAGNVLTCDTIKKFLGPEADVLGVESVRSTLMEMMANATISTGGYETIYGHYKSGKELQLIKLQELKNPDNTSVIIGARYKLLKYFGKPLNVIKDSFDRYIKRRLGL